MKDGITILLIAFCFILLVAAFLVTIATYGYYMDYYLGGGEECENMHGVYDTGLYSKPRCYVESKEYIFDNDRWKEIK